MSKDLEKSLGPWLIWALGVGYVISGMYFGWNLGLPVGGPYGMLFAMTIVTAMYVTFVLSYSELACAIPQAGGAFVYGSRALGVNWGFLGGVAQIIEFVFAPPAIAAAIGAYFNLFFPTWDPLWIAIAAYAAFTGLNIYGVKQSAIFELVITVLAVAELLIFVGVVAPSFSLTAFQTNPLPNGWSGAFAAIPFAIWFYLAIEGIANVAEESKNPKRDISRGFGSAMATLVVLAVLVFFGAVGVGGWEAIVYAPGSTHPSDSPLPLALGQIVGDSHILFHLLVTIGLFGLIASFHGIILIAGRATFEFGRVGYAPKWLGQTLDGRKTPAAALILNMCIGIIALLTGKTAEIITIAVFGALTLYFISSLSLFRLRKIEPKLKRPYTVPFYPWVPLTSLILSGVCLISVIWSSPKLALLFLVFVAIAYAWFFIAVPKSVRSKKNKELFRK